MTTETSALHRWLAPSFTAFLFLIHPLAITLLKPGYPLSDPGTGWHLAIGRYIVETGSLPTHDIFSFTVPNHEWISNYWLFEVVTELLVRAGGLPLYIIVCVLIYGLLPVLLFRRMIRMNAGLLPAFVFTLIAYLVLWSHALARPHVLTYVFIAVTIERLDDYRRGNLPARRLWWLPLLTMIWCNAHGGFVAGLTVTGIFAAAAALSAVYHRDRRQAHQAGVFVALLAAMLLATLVNPHGLALHQSIAATLDQAAVRYLLDWASPDFRTATMPVFFFETLVLITIALLVHRRGSIPLVEVALLVFFLHQALHAMRHINLFAIVAAPILAREVTPLLENLAPAFHARCRRITEAQQALRSSYLYFPMICAVFVCLTLARVVSLPENLDGTRLSARAASFIAAHEDRFGRMFNTDDLGGSLVYRFWPKIRIFIDDRIPVYGDDFIINRYLPVYFGKKDWRKVLTKYRVTSAVLTSSTPCTTLFRESPEWQIVFEDRLNIIFFRTAGLSR